jgi:hypothetical protein
MNAVLESLRHQVSVLTERLQWLESRREMVGVQVSSGILVAGFALITLSSAIDLVALQVGLSVFGAGLSLTGAAMLLVFTRQTGDAPRVPSAGQGKWFYVTALRDYDQFSVPWHGMLSRQARANLTQHMEAEWAAFFPAAAAVARDAKIDAVEDLRQVLSLHVMERYRYQFLVRLRTLLVGGLIGSAAVGAVTAAATAVA